MSDDVLICTDLPARVDEAKLWPRLRVDGRVAEEAAVRDILRVAMRSAKPKGMVRRCRVEERRGESVRISGEVFESRLLSRQFRDVATVYAFVLTGGEELEEHDPPRDDLMGRFWWDEVKTAVMRQAHLALQQRMAEAFGTPPDMAFLSPGSGDVGLWSVEAQKPLLRLLGDVEHAIGVRLTESCCMIPRHTISGFHYPRTTSFVTCKVCRQSACPDRLAPFEPDLWQTFQR